MKVKEPGVLPGSYAYFHTPSLLANQLFFTVNCTGCYLCNSSYAVKRSSYDSFLILHVIRGKGYCYINQQRIALHAGAVVILDCYQPHCYGTDSEWEISWIHFGGRLARDYYESISQIHRQIILPKNSFNAARGLEKIYNMFHVDKRINEALISKNITSILTEFLICDQPYDGIPEHSLHIEKVLSFIDDNFDQQLTLELLAGQASLSPFYFSRIFKKETGYTLRDYLFKTRVNAARFYLRTTDLSLKQISYRCGYGCESAFCTAFKRATGMTPIEYRGKNS